MFNKDPYLHPVVAKEKLILVQLTGNKLGDGDSEIMAMVSQATDNTGYCVKRKSNLTGMGSGSHRNC